MRQLGGLQGRISEIEKSDAEVIAIATAGGQQDVESTKRSLRITYILIPKPNRKVVKDYGLEYQKIAYAKYPGAYATIIIDKKGRIRYKSVNEIRSRTSASRITRELQGL